LVNFQLFFGFGEEIVDVRIVEEESSRGSLVTGKLPWLPIILGIDVFK